MADQMIITLNEDTRAGRMLAAGQVTCSVVSHKTGHHITVRLRCKMDNRAQTNGPKRWLGCHFADATHVFMDVPSPDGWSDKIGTYYPLRGTFFIDKDADSARVYAAKQVVAYLAGEPTQCEVLEEVRCGRCGRELTDPVSIMRGIGPECYEQETGSHHQVKQHTAATTSKEDTMGKTVKRVNIEPHWPGMLRWLEALAISDQQAHPDAVAITGGADTDMYAVWDDQVMKFIDGTFKPAYIYETEGKISRGAEWDDVLAMAYCYKDPTGIWVAGECVEPATPTDAD